jgi:hypothetical protein
METTWVIEGFGVLGWGALDHSNYHSKEVAASVLAHHIRTALPGDYYSAYRLVEYGRIEDRSDV